MASAQSLAQEFDAVLAALREGTGASRTTLRIDLPAFGFHVNDVAGEACAEGEKSLRGETGINQRAVETVKWLDRERRPLVQEDLLTAEVPAPPALIEIYGAKAQMLAPLVAGGALQGWVSVHYSKGPRRWTAQEIAMLEAAVENIKSALSLLQ